ncbi:MAG: HPr family phosphocarrier protein [Acetatifactor sp.]|nr:HPr family phosphocarrier protein [Acetatifactor sp.]
MNMIKVQFRGLDSVKNFVNILSKFECDFDIVDKRYVIDAKSIMGLFSLDLTHPLDLKIYSEDEAVVKSVIESLDDFNYVVK